MSRRKPIVLEVPHVPSGPNQLLRLHRRARSAEWSLWRGYVALLARRHRLQRAEGPCFSEIVCYRLPRRRLRDRVNVIGACKVVEDALEAAGLIYSDRIDWHAFHARQEAAESPRDVRTVIWIRQDVTEPLAELLAAAYLKEAAAQSR